MPPRLYRIFFTSSAENFAAFCLRTTSSSLGCRQVPVGGVEGADCATGVEGRIGVDILERRVQATRALPQDCETVSFRVVVFNVNKAKGHCWKLTLLL